jgi:hypothetical protein
MLADLDLLLTAVFCTADDLLPEKAKNARRSVTDAEVVTLAVAQAIMGVSSDDRFLRLAGRSLNGLFPKLPKQPGFHKRRAKLTETIEWLIGVFAEQSAGERDDLVLIDSTPVECARSVETGRRSAFSDAAGREFEPAVADMSARLLRPNRKDEPDNRLHRSAIRQRIESIF